VTNSTNARMFLWLGLAMALWLNYEAWQRMFAPPPAAVTAPAPTAAMTAVPAAAATVAAPGAAPATTTATVRVTTDVLDLEIALAGGTLVNADLPRYPRVKG